MIISYRSWQSFGQDLCLQYMDMKNKKIDDYFYAIIEQYHAM